MTMLSSLGMYNYNDTLFDNLQLPSGINKDDVIDSILFETAELELLYSDYDYLKDLIGLWSKRELPTWEKLLELFNEDYNPLYNVDAWETLTENRDLHGTRNIEESGNNTEDATNTIKVTGFNNNSFTNSEQTTVDVDRNNTSNSDEISSDTGTITTTNRRYGNIGVTMSQQMVDAEMRVRPKMNIINYITESYKKRFCLMIY